MSRTGGAAVARADLLRALAAAGQADGLARARSGQAVGEADRLLANGLGFYPSLSPATAPTAGESVIGTAQATSIKLTVAEPAPARAPLRIGFFGIVHCEPLASEVTTVATRQEQPKALGPADFAASNSLSPPFLPLANKARLAARLHADLPRREVGNALDVARVAQQLARWLPPARWARKSSIWPPGQVVLLLDRSMAMRVFWQDQQYLLNRLARWLGPTRLASYNVLEDPWQPARGYLFGKKQVAPRLLPVGADGAVLLVTRGGDARWQQVAQFMRQNGAAMWWYDVASNQLTPEPVTEQSASEAAWARFLTILSCARCLEPALLRALRLLDPLLAQQPQLEAQVWASPLFETGYDVAVWRAEAHSNYRQRFFTLPIGLQQQVWHTLQQHHASRGRAIWVQEALALASHAAPEAIDAAMALEVGNAKRWLAGLLACDEAHPGHAGFADFAGQWFAFHANDAALVAAHEDEFARLWAIADAASLAQGGPGLVGGSLAAEKMARAKHLAGLKAASYHFGQVGGQWALLRADTLPPAARPGMPQELAWLQIDGQRVLTHGQARVPVASLANLAGLSQGGSVRLQTPSLRLRLGQIELPFGFERGRDEFGVYALWPVAGQVICLRYIEPGQFWMGSPEEEGGWGSGEGARHLVTISHGFWLADTACSQALWQGVMGTNPSHFNENNGGGPNHPVEQVTWEAVQQFLAILTGLLPEESDFMATLPTEAEWEYACRAGTTTPFWFGEDIHIGQANCGGKTPFQGERKGEYRRKTVPVKTFSPNGWGLYQMHGNVWEWCGDVLRDYGAAEVDPGLVDVLSPQGDRGSRLVRAIRGGSWGSDSRGARSAYRGKDLQFWQRKNDDLGFRLALRSRRGSTGA